MKLNLIDNTEIYETPIYFNTENISEVINIPLHKPGIKKVLTTMVSPIVERLDLVETEKGVSYEGNKSTGSKIIVRLKLKGKITYVADDRKQSVHVLNYELSKSVYIVLPEEEHGKKTCELFRGKRINAIAYIDGVYSRILDYRTIYNCILLFVEARICDFR